MRIMMMMMMLMLMMMMMMMMISSFESCQHHDCKPRSVRTCLRAALTLFSETVYVVLRSAKTRALVTGWPCARRLSTVELTARSRSCAEGTGRSWPWSSPGGDTGAFCSSWRPGMGPSAAIPSPRVCVMVGVWGRPPPCPATSAMSDWRSSCMALAAPTTSSCSAAMSSPSSAEAARSSASRDSASSLSIFT